MLAPRYDFPQTIETVREWFREAEMEQVTVEFGWNGIEGRGRTRLRTSDDAALTG